MFVWRIALTAALPVLFAASVAAEPWPRFRGPNGTGVSEATTIPARWTTADYRWRVRLPGVGHSSPVVWGEQIFVTSAEEEDATQIVRCLRTSNGGLIWKRSFESSTHPKNDFTAYASASPALDEKHVYLAWATPERYIVLALEKQKGREVWRRDLGPFEAEHGFGASPIVFDDLVILANDQNGPSSIVALDCSSGEARWKTERKAVKAGYATPCLYYPANGPAELILNSCAHGLTSLDPLSGKVNWELPVLDLRVVGSPVVAGGLIWAGAGVGGGGKQYVGVRPGRPSEGIEPEVIHNLTGSLPYVPTSVAHGDLLFLWADRGVATCVDAPSGKIHWQERIGGNYFGSPIRVGDRLYCISRDGEMVVLAASDQFEELARISLEEPSHATPAVADGVMYLRTLTHLMAIGSTEVR